MTTKVGLLFADFKECELGEQMQGWVRDFVGFYRLCLRRAFPGAWAATWISSTILTILCPLVVYFWTPFGTVAILLASLVPLAIFLVVMIGGPLIAAFWINRELEQQIFTLKAQLSKKKSEKEIQEKQRQKFQDQINGLRPEEKEALRQLIAKVQMRPQDFQQCSIEKCLAMVDTHRMKAAVTFLHHDKTTGFYTIDPTVRDLIAELLV